MQAEKLCNVTFRKKDFMGLQSRVRKRWRRERGSRNDDDGGKELKADSLQEEMFIRATNRKLGDRTSSS